MAHPYHHSLSSVRKFGGQVSDYIAIHSWFDATKAHTADFRHRSLRHHLEGIERLILLKGVVIQNSDGVPVQLRDIGVQHVSEDCEKIVSINDWCEHIRTESWMFPRNPKCFEPWKKWGGVAEDYSFVSEFFEKYHPYCFHHSAGCFDLEASAGYTVMNADGKPVPTRVLAEEYLRTLYGIVPSPIDWLKSIRPLSWMVKTKRIESSLKQ
jgi:hypothetical protein